MSSYTETIEDYDDEPSASDAGLVYAWRLEELLRAGYPIDGAALIASTTGVDLHDAVRLVERGCPASLALRILL